MMRLALVSTRRVKRLLAEQALDQGDTLTAFVSDPATHGIATP